MVYGQWRSWLVFPKLPICSFLNFNLILAQPMCDQTLPTARWDCSHVFALTVWAESVRSSAPTFPALSCATWDNFISQSCNGNQVGHLGRTTESNLRGSYMLRTNMLPPYSRNTALPF